MVAKRHLKLLGSAVLWELPGARTGKSKFSAVDLLHRACCYTWAWEWSSLFGTMNSTVNTSSFTGSAGFKCNWAQNVAKKKQPVLLCFKTIGFTWLGQFQQKNRVHAGHFIALLNKNALRDLRHSALNANQEQRDKFRFFAQVLTQKLSRKDPACIRLSVLCFSQCQCITVSGLVSNLRLLGQYWQEPHIIF